MPASSPATSHRTGKSMSTNEAKASSEKLQRALQSNNIRSSVSSPSTNAALEITPLLAETSLTISPPENLESVVRKIPIPSDSTAAEINASEATRAPSSEDGATACDAESEKKPKESAGKNIMDKTDEPNPARDADKDESKDQETGLSTAAAESRESNRGTTGAAEAEDIELVAESRQNTGATADDAVEIDPSPNEQLEQEHQLSQHAGDGDQETAYDTPGSVVSSQWLLAKLDGLSADTLEAGRAAIRQELRDMEATVARLPRASMPSTSSVTGIDPGQRLRMVETLIAPQLAKIPGHCWLGYKSRLLRMCSRGEAHNMDYRQRLEKVKEIVYLPEEMQLVHGDGSAERIGCAIRVCATVTEILGRDDEVVPEEMTAWVAAQLRDVTWKAKVTSAWRKYWPEAAATVVD
ncbi:hypothetical protein IF1G_03873 [Cordyceps javanica]|uniref:Uncharacterized protein n=1 Tax=Cordyceps javanica TaxID=43265 RepID=A0A545W471_9HYPO|nr:hypothetical protein IF1G_03873 [Cordyceps javanica]TQW08695.1 hypothetical protein IF2G_03126 [Cordyceps javanica]